MLMSEPLSERGDEPLPLGSVVDRADEVGLVGCGTQHDAGDVRAEYKRVTESQYSAAGGILQDLPQAPLPVDHSRRVAEREVLSRGEAEMRTEAGVGGDRRSGREVDWRWVERVSVVTQRYSGSSCARWDPRNRESATGDVGRSVSVNRSSLTCQVGDKIRDVSFRVSMNQSSLRSQVGDKVRNLRLRVRVDQRRVEIGECNSARPTINSCHASDTETARKEVLEIGPVVDSVAHLELSGVGFEAWFSGVEDGVVESPLTGR